MPIQHCFCVYTKQISYDPRQVEESDTLGLKGTLVAEDFGLSQFWWASDRVLHDPNMRLNSKRSIYRIYAIYGRSMWFYNDVDEPER